MLFLLFQPLHLLFHSSSEQINANAKRPRRNAQTTIPAFASPAEAPKVLLDVVYESAPRERMAKFDLMLVLAVVEILAHKKRNTNCISWISPLIECSPDAFSYPAS